MKLFNGKEDSLYLTRKQWTKLFVAFSIMVLILYVAAMVASLCGSKYFILNYQNEQMDRIESWLRERNAIGILSWLFSTFEFAIILAFVTLQPPKWYYLLAFYLPIVILSFFFKMPAILYNCLPLVFYIGAPIIELSIKKELSWKNFGKSMLRLLIAFACVIVLQIMIYVIKSGSFTTQSLNLPLSANFCYALEYDIALAVILFTIVLLSNREKGDSKVWITLHGAGSSSQTSMMQSQKSNQKKNLTKTQRNKLRRLYAKIYLSQLGGFLLLMVLPFLLGKVLEFLVMYVAFAVARYILGFKYSLHYKKESICITVGTIVFGVLSLAVPFFYVVLILAVIIGISLAVLLHLSYKYKGFYLFAKMAKADRFALLYTYFDGDIDHHHVKVMCKHKGLDDFQAQIIAEFMDGNKMSYIAWKHNYSLRMMNYKIDEAIEKLIH